MEDKELYNPQNGEVIKAKRPKQFWKDWRFYVYTLIAIMLAIVSFSSCLTACAAINAGVGQKEDASYSVAQRKNASGTTSGGYTSYTFGVTPAWGDLGDIYACAYDVDTSSYDLTLIEDNLITSSGSYWHVSVPFIEEAIELYQPTTQNDLRFLAVWGYTPWWGSGTTMYWVYFSFLIPTNGLTVIPRSFIMTTSWSNAKGIQLENPDYAWNVNSRAMYLTFEKSNQILVDTRSTATTEPLERLAFQDVASYYQELGYQDGYDVGDSVGYESGHSAGYNEGYASGNANGYASGYEQATQDYQTGIAFTSYGLYANAQLTLTTDEVIGNYSYMYLFKYVTSNYDEHTVYVLFTQNSSTSQYLGYVLDRNDSDDSTSAVTIGSFSAQSSLAVTITAEQDQYFELYTGFVTSFYDRGSEVIEAVWFSGGTSQTALQNYQDGYDTGYQDGVSAGYGSGYDAGYRVGEVAGINQAEPEALTNTLVAVFQQPFNQIYRFFNFNILGLNVLGLATGLLSVFIIIKVFKKVLK